MAGLIGQRGRGLDIQKWLASTGREFHWPGYQYLGPGTHLKKRLKRGDPGINHLDWIAKQHNINYACAKNLRDKHAADRKMIQASDPLRGRKTHTEQMVKKIMQAKVQLKWVGREWRERGLPADTLLENLSKMLNSNENFEFNDSFNLSVVHVRPPPRGTGKKRYVPGHLSKVWLHEGKKKSLVKIHRDEEGWCVAKAIVTTRALHLAGHDQYARKRWTCPCRNFHRRHLAAERLMAKVGLGPGAWGPDQ